MYHGDFYEIAVAVDCVFAPIERDMFISYMEQFNDVIKYLNGEEQEGEKNE